MCVSWKNTLIRIINELWAEKRCCWTNGDPFGEEHSNPLPKCTCHKKPNWNGSLMKTNILCNPQGGNDYKWGVPPPDLPGFPEKESVSVNPCLSPVRGHEEGVRPEGPFPESLMCCLAFLSMKTGWEKSFAVERRQQALSPPPLLADVFFFRCKSSLISPY